MLIINTTFFISDSHLDMFLKWIKDNYIPAMTSTDHFSGHHFYKVLAEQEPGSSSYSLQLELSGTDAHDRWNEHYIHELRRELKLLFNENVLSFSTLLEKL